MSISVPTSPVSQSQVYKDQDAVKDAVKNGGNVKEAIQQLVMDQGALNKQNGTTDTLDKTKSYMDSWLKQNGVDSKKFDDSFDETVNHTAGMLDPTTGKVETGAAGSLEALADSIMKSVNAGPPPDSVHQDNSLPTNI